MSKETKTVEAGEHLYECMMEATRSVYRTVAPAQDWKELSPRKRDLYAKCEKNLNKNKKVEEFDPFDL